MAGEMDNIEEEARLAAELIQKVEEATSFQDLKGILQAPLQWKLRDKQYDLETVI